MIATRVSTSERIRPEHCTPRIVQTKIRARIRFLFETPDSNEDLHDFDLSTLQVSCRPDGSGGLAVTASCDLIA